MAWKTTFGALVALASLSIGCELLTTVDRNKVGENGGTAGTGGTTSSGGTGGDVTTDPTGGNTGGSTTCDVGSCPAPSGPCKVAYCDDSAQCAEKDADDGSPSANQVPGDCKQNVCTAGVETSTNDDADVEDDGHSCTEDTCNAGSPQHTPLTLGTSCSESGGSVCDDAGACVECNADADCADNAPNVVCDANHTCVPEVCANGVEDGDETDIDCGGSSCGKCADTLGCLVAADCQSNRCEGATCVAGTCNDGILNNTQLGETDVDCGGGCPDCGFDKTCSVNADCKSGDCTMSKCAATCSDGEKDQDEGDVDCGGVCADCIVGQTCNVAGDCQSNYCDGTGHCAACGNTGDCAPTEHCTAGVCVNDKANGLACATGAECQSGNCVDGVCCGSATCGTCQSCGVSGSEGTCTNLAAGLNDDTCLQAANKQCDGGGACKTVNGKACGVAGECLSGNCVDTVCCATACGGKCQSCNLAGAIGSCSNIPAATDPDSECSQGQDGSATCNGLAACGDTGPTGAVCVPNAMSVCTNGGGTCPANGICP